MQVGLVKGTQDMQDSEQQDLRIYPGGNNRQTQAKLSDTPSSYLTGSLPYAGVPGLPPQLPSSLEQQAAASESTRSRTKEAPRKHLAAWNTPCGTNGEIPIWEQGARIYSYNQWKRTARQ